HTRSSRRCVATRVCPQWVRRCFFFQAEDGIRDFHVTGFRRVLFRSLDRILHLQLPSADDVDQVANELSEAATRLAALEETEAGRSRRSIDLLEAALAEHADHGDQPCPVCGEGVLDTDWRSRAEAQVQELKRTAAAYDEAARALDETRRRAQSLIAPVPFELSASVAGLETEPCREQWERWASPPADPEGLEEHLRTAFPPFATEFEQL